MLKIRNEQLYDQRQSHSRFRPDRCVVRRHRIEAVGRHYRPLVTIVDNLASKPPLVTGRGSRQRGVQCNATFSTWPRTLTFNTTITGAKSIIPSKRVSWRN